VTFPRSFMFNVVLLIRNQVPVMYFMEIRMLLSELRPSSCAVCHHFRWIDIRDQLCFLACYHLLCDGAQPSIAYRGGFPRDDYSSNVLTSVFLQDNVVDEIIKKDSYSILVCLFADCLSTC
jgi:hypothetical protein